MITIENAPPAFALCDDYLLFQAASTNVAEDGFRYVVKIRINGTDLAPLETLKFYVYPNKHLKCIVDISMHISNYFYLDGIGASGEEIFADNWDTYNLKTPMGFTGIVRVDIGEYFGGTEQNFVTRTLELLRGMGNIQEGLHPDRSNLKGLTGIPATPPYTYTYGEDSPAMFAVPFNQGLDDVQFISGGNLLTLQLTAANGLAGDYDDTEIPNFMACIPVGKPWLQQVFTANGLGAVGDSVSVLLRAAGMPQLEIAVQYVCEPPKNQTATLFWANSIGGIETMYFEGCTKTTRELEGKTMLRPVGGFNDSAASILPTHRTHEMYQKTAQTTFAVHTVHADGAKSRRISSLASSRYVWLYTNGTYYPVHQESSTAEVFVGTKSEMQEVSLEFTLSQTERC